MQAAFRPSVSSISAVRLLPLSSPCVLVEARGCPRISTFLPSQADAISSLLREGSCLFPCLDPAKVVGRPARWTGGGASAAPDQGKSGSRIGEHSSRQSWFGRNRPVSWQVLTEIHGRKDVTCGRKREGLPANRGNGSDRCGWRGTGPRRSRFSVKTRHERCRSLSDRDQCGSMLCGSSSGSDWETCSDE